MRAKAPGRQTRRGPDPVDIHVAMRVRERRTELGLTQSELAGALGITFQSLYKYEKGKNRISAGRLYGLSKALGVPVTFFFEGIAGIEAKARKPKRSKTGLSLLPSRDAAPERSKQMERCLKGAHVR